MRPRFIVLVITLAFVLGGVCAPAHAHIFGYHAIDHDISVTIAPDGIALRMVVMPAEIPTASLLATVDEDRDGELSDEESEKLVVGYEESLRDDLKITLNGKRAVLAFESGSASVISGVTPMPQLQMLFRFRVVKPQPKLGRNTLHVHNLCHINTLGTRDLYFRVREPGRVEIVGEPTKIDSRDPELYQVAIGLLPPDYREATVVFEVKVGESGTVPSQDIGGAEEPEALAARKRTPLPERKGWLTKTLLSLKDTLFSLIRDFAENHSRAVLLLALGLAFVIGMLHAVQPGHGKTLVAAYLVGTHGKIRHAVLLGLIVTLTHTFSVYIIALAVLHGVKSASDQNVIWWIQLGSGIGIFAIGAWMFSRAIRGKALPHVHVGGGHHDHHDHAHGHSHNHEQERTHDQTMEQDVEPPRLKRLLALGITGGVVPCPDGILIILACAYAQVVAFGIMVLVSFSLGLAATLVAIGILVVRGSKVITRRLKKPGHFFQYAAITSSILICLIGLALAYAAARPLLKTPSTGRESAALEDNVATETNDETGAAAPQPMDGSDDIAPEERNEAPSSDSGGAPPN